MSDVNHELGPYAHFPLSTNTNFESYLQKEPRNLRVHLIDKRLAGEDKVKSIKNKKQYYMDTSHDDIDVESLLTEIYDYLHSWKITKDSDEHKEKIVKKLNKCLKEMSFNFLERYQMETKKQGYRTINSTFYKESEKLFQQINVNTIQIFAPANSESLSYEDVVKASVKRRQEVIEKLNFTKAELKFLDKKAIDKKYNRFWKTVNYPIDPTVILAAILNDIFLRRRPVSVEMINYFIGVQVLLRGLLMDPYAYNRITQEFDTTKLGRCRDTKQVNIGIVYAGNLHVELYRDWLIKDDWKELGEAGSIAHSTDIENRCLDFRIIGPLIDKHILTVTKPPPSKWYQEIKLQFPIPIMERISPSQREEEQEQAAEEMEQIIAAKQRMRDEFGFDYEDEEEDNQRLKLYRPNEEDEEEDEE